jgi:OTU domain-containing protein 3
MGRNKKNSTKLNKKQREKKRRGNRKYNDLQWKIESYKLKNQVQRYGLDIKEIRGDGNCMFRAISDQLCGNEDMHVELRHLAVEHVKNNQDDFSPFIEDDENFDKYIKRMSELCTWGGNIELQALSQVLEVNIKIHRVDEPIWEIINHYGARSIHLSYHDGDHYNSVRLKGDLTDSPPVNIPEKLQVLETSPDQVSNQFNQLAEMIKDLNGLEDTQKTVRVLKKLYKDSPEYDVILEDIGKICDVYYQDSDTDEDTKNSSKIDSKKNQSGQGKKNHQQEEKKTDDKKNKLNSIGKRPIKLPTNKQKCWCGSGKTYKSCCKATDHLREPEEEKFVTELETLQI